MVFTSVLCFLIHTRQPGSATIVSAACATCLAVGGKVNIPTVFSEGLPLPQLGIRGSTHSRPSVPSASFTQCSRACPASRTRLCACKHQSVGPSLQRQVSATCDCCRCTRLQNAATCAPTYLSYRSCSASITSACTRSTSASKPGSFLSIFLTGIAFPMCVWEG
jgi:hypothetical protein